MTNPELEQSEQKDDEERVVLIIAAVVFAFFASLAAWLMAPDFFSTEPDAPLSAGVEVEVDVAVATSAPRPVTPSPTPPPISAPSAAVPAIPSLPRAPISPAPQIQPPTQIQSPFETDVAMPAPAEEPATPAATTNQLEATTPVPTPTPATEIATTPQPSLDLTLEPPVASVADTSITDALEEASSSVSFYAASTELTDESKVILDRVATLMSKNPTQRLGIIGHTDSQGEADANVKLSFARAVACANYLAAKGVNNSRIDAAGMGEQMPIAQNQTPAGRQRNRRVEFKLLE